MRHFVVTVDFTVPFEQLGEAVPRHRAFLQRGYDQGLLLMSGPRVPRTGGMVVARTDSRDDLIRFFAEDPYRLEGLATHAFVEFEPVMAQGFLSDWTS